MTLERPTADTLTVQEILTEFRRLGLWLVRDRHFRLNYGPLYPDENLPESLHHDVRLRHRELLAVLPCRSEKQLATMLEKFKRDRPNLELLHAYKQAHNRVRNSHQNSTEVSP